MFDKLIFVNYKGGMGGEFFSWILSNAANKKIQSVVYDPLLNKYGFKEYDDILFNSNSNHLFLIVVNQYDSPEDYFLNYSCLGDEDFYKKFIDKNYYMYSRVKKTFYTYIYDTSYQQMLDNLTMYYSDHFSPLAKQIKIKDNIEYLIQPVHYVNNNKLNVNLTQFFKGSKKITFYCEEKYHYFFSLLRSVKMFQHNKDRHNLTHDQLERFFIMDMEDYNLEKKLFDSDLNIDIGNLYFNKLNIDNKLSDFIGTDIKLDYNEIDRYNNRNVNLLMNSLNFDVNKQYSIDQIKTLLSNYILKAVNV